MNRRGILALLGGAVAMPSAGLKAAAETLGVSNVIGVGSGVNEVVGCAPSVGWWNSPLQMSLDAKERANHDMRAGTPYPHMKSWGHAFRSSVVERDHQILLVYRQKMQEDSEFREKVFMALGVIG
jgi:hypothetical protein